jgi:hypothetical protein
MISSLLLLTLAAASLDLSDADTMIAINCGAGKAPCDPIGNYVVASGSGPTVTIETPFLKVRLFASAEKRKYRDVRIIDVPAALRSPRFTVRAEAKSGPDFASPVLSVDHVIVVTRGRNGVEEIHQPLALEEKPERWSNAYGATKEGRSIRADFPLELLRPGAEIRVVTTVGERRTVLTGDDLARIR